MTKDTMSAGFRDVPQFEEIEDVSLPPAERARRAAADPLLDALTGPRRAKPRRKVDLALEVRDALIDLAFTPNGRPADTSSLARPGYTGKRRLSDYERAIAHALIRKGHPKSQAIAMARGLLKKAARSDRWGDHGRAGAATRAGARASIAQRKTF